MGEYNFTIYVSGWVEWIIAAPLLFCRIVRYGYSFRLIKLTKGYFAKVDQADFVRLRMYSWMASNHKGRGYTLYAQRTICEGRRRYTRMMHREIMFGLNSNYKNSKKSRQKENTKLYVDHINGDGLDNRRANLRIVTAQQNNWNRRFRRTGRSKYTGVTWDGRRDKWRADIYENRRKIFLGHFAAEEEAARAYDSAAKENRGEYAVLNFPCRMDKGKGN